MATHRERMLAKGLLFFIFYILFVPAVGIRHSDITDSGIFQTYGNSLRNKLKKLFETETDFETLEKTYQENEKYVTLAKVNGSILVKEMSEKLEQLLALKMKALKKSASKAEELAAKHKWDKNLKKEDVVYQKAKEVNTSGDGWEDSTNFQQRVNFNMSSVHIPVEIFDGENGILNGLQWSGGLDEVWSENYKEDKNLLWQYFGSQKGFLRSYPAKKWQQRGPVDLYDVRRRPWYTQGSSSPKDMLILIDRSGSTHGQALKLMKQSAISLLDTLGENDFVHVAMFNDNATDITCQQNENISFIQANYRNKQKLIENINAIKADRMAKFSVALEYAFKTIQEFNSSARYREDGTGAMCNPIIMVLTDGGEEIPEEVVKKYNWPEKRIRIFSYAVGPTAAPITGVKWMACSNRGYFSKIPAMGAIRSTVQDHVRVLARPQALSYAKHYSWTTSYHRGLGMMTTVTLPVYHTSAGSSNQTVLGVMGTDVAVAELEQFIPSRELGPNGYAFAISNNGYIIFHPNLKAKYGWLDDPPNVDLLEVEHENEEKEMVRKSMINEETGFNRIVTHISRIDPEYTEEKTRTYYYQHVMDTSFSLGLVLPDYCKYYITGIQNLTLQEGLKYLQTDNSTILLADKEFCPNLTASDNQTEKVEQLAEWLKDNPDKCNMNNVEHLVWDAMVTAAMESKWEETQDESKFVNRFVATTSGMTRIYPKGDYEDFEELTDTWHTTYFSRSLDNADRWMIFPQHLKASFERNPNISAPTIMIAKAVQLKNQYFTAVVGGKLNQTTLRQMLLHEVTTCTGKYICYLIDDGGYLVVSSDPAKDHKTGAFMGEIDPVLMNTLYEHGVFLRNEEYDFQAACQKKEPKASAGIRSVLIPSFLEMLTLKWWTTKLAWAYLNMNFYNWIFGSPSSMGAYADSVGDQANVSCILHQAQYYANVDSKKQVVKESFECGNCSRQYVSYIMEDINMVLIQVDDNLYCQEDCDASKELLRRPVEVSDPRFEGNTCVIKPRYRKRPPCFEYDPREKDDKCGAISFHLSTKTLTLQVAMGIVLAMVLRF